MIRNRLREFRELHGYSQAEVAQMAGISPQIVIAVETVEGYSPKMDTAEKLCRVFNRLPVERMFWFDYSAELEALREQPEAVAV